MGAWVARAVGLFSALGAHFLLIACSAQPPSASGAPEPVETWQLLGMLSEYSGRFVLEEDDRVESFFCDETDVAQHFERLVERLPEDVALRRSETPGSTCGAVTFRSALLAEQLNSFYDFEYTSDRRAPDASGRYRRTAKAHLKRSTLAEGGEEAERAFLAGVLARYRRDDELFFANALPKVDLTRELLLEHGCADAPLTSRTDTVPNTHRLGLESCGPLLSSLGSLLE